jgi:hypothetical protein
LPGSYRPIALLSCLGKIFESILTKRITFWAENNNALADGHFGGRASRSTDDANLFLTSWIRQKWREKKIVSALFLDVKSAFPTVIRERLLNHLKIKNAPSYFLSIISSFLSNRSTSLKMEDYLSSSFPLKCGLPQGSPLSPILYIIYNSSLLIDCQLDLKQDSLSLGFIDDVTHLVAEKYLETSIRKLEEEGCRSPSWGHDHNAIFDRKKAKFMIFTHNAVDVRPFKFGDISLPASQSVKYLGIIFDSKLLFTDHIKKVKKCGDQTASQLIRISRCSFGIGFHQSKNLIISVLYGSAIWATERKNSTINNLFKKIDNLANRIILGVFKTTPCAFLQRDSPLIPFFEILKRKNHLYIIKKCTAPPSHPIKRLIDSEISASPSTHPSPIHNILDRHLISTSNLSSIETIHPHIINPWEDFSLPISNLKIKKEEIKSKVQLQIENLKSKYEHLIFTDGSNIPENGSASAALLDNTTEFSC